MAFEVDDKPGRTPSRRGAVDPTPGTGASQWVRVMAELAAVRDIDGLVEVIVAHSAAAVAASVASLSVLDPAGETLTLIAVRGGRPDAVQLWARYPATIGTPAGAAVVTRATVVVSGRDEVERDYPSLTGYVMGEGSLICLPLIVGDRVVGVISLSVTGAWTPDAGEDEFLSMFADACAQTLERVQARAAADDIAAKLEFLARASAELASSLDYRATLSTVANLAVPMLADWCAVEVVEDGVLRTLAVAHVDPAMVALAWQLQKDYPTDMSASTGAPNVVRTGASELYPQVTDEMLVAGTRDAEHLRLSRALGLRSGLVVPLTARERVLGVISLVSAESGRVYGPGDVAFAEDLARRAGVAVDNAHLHSETLEAALRLQRAVLPDSLEQVAGWEIATHYRPAGRTEVGGDFYDAVALPDGRLIVLIGDVMGRGVAAAAAMARMRAAVHAYLATDPDPQPVVSRLDRMFTLFHPSRLVTMVYGVIAASGRELTLVNAGHCPPALIGPDGVVTLLRAEPGPPLGVETLHRQAYTWPTTPDSTLLLYTDGLIERRDEMIDDGLQRLVHAAATLGHGRLGQLLPALVTEVRDSRFDDDVTALAVRQAPAP